MAKGSNALAVNSRTVESVYRDYLLGEYSVNRRYQRKLVWTVQEKERLIESILYNFPLPQFLVAELPDGSEYKYEIIDGMQRMNAIIAFIENEYPVGGEYFDLASLASTKQLLDKGSLVQNEPKLSRDKSVQIATYEIAQSVYSTDEAKSVEEVFRRINSSGQKLSAQDLRQAGSSSPVADVVRRISSRIRGDDSPTDEVPLSGMKALSISSAYNEYGIDPDTMFWIRHGILRRPDVRSSADEQLVLDIVADMLFDPMLSTGTPVRNALFQVEDSSAPEAIELQIRSELSSPDWLKGKGDALVEEFMLVFSRVQVIIDSMPAETSFKRHIGTTGNNPVPRYFEAIFAAVHRLMIKDAKDHSNVDLAVEQLDSPNAFKKMPPGGGEWKAQKKRTTVNALKRALSHAFDIPLIRDASLDTTDTLGRNEFDSIISGALVETSGRDMKQGFMTLSPQGRSFDTRSFDKMMKTLTAISNRHPRSGGHIFVGIADSDADAEQVARLDGVSAIVYRSLRIVGIDRELQYRGESLDTFWQSIIRRIADHAELPTDYARRVASDAKVAVHEGRTIFVLPAPVVSSPVAYGDKYYTRLSSDTREIENQVEFTIEFMSRMSDPVGG